MATEYKDWLGNLKNTVSGLVSNATKLAQENAQQQQQQSATSAPYNPTYTNINDAITDVIKYKQWYKEAQASGDTAAMDNAHDRATKAYSWLDMYGGADGKTAANKLSQLDYDNAVKWATDGKHQLRNYAYTTGQQYGLSQADIDKYINYDNTTRNISFGGKNIGTPDVVIDGVSYISDTTALDNAIKELAKNTNTNLSERELSQRNNTEINEKMNQLWGTQTSDRQMMTDKYGRLEEASYANPFTTEEARAILGKYDLAALQGRDNAVASGGASNGGNIDSYAAANAMRQQAALTNQGQMAVLDAYNNKLNNVRSTLEGLGVYLQNQDAGMQKTIGMQQNEAQRLFENAESYDQRLFDNEQTALNNETDRLVSQASVTGYVPTKWQYVNNPYLNEDGTVNANYLSEAFDATGGFKTMLNEVEEKLKTTTDATERAKLKNEEYYLQQAINQKIKTDASGKYAQWANTTKVLTPQITEPRRESEQNDKTTRYVTDQNADTTKYSADKSVEASNYAADASANAAVNKVYAEGAVQKDLIETQAEFEKEVEPFRMQPIDETLISQHNVDEYGKKAIEGLIDLANSNDNYGVLTKEQIIDYLYKNSSKNFTNIDQLTKVSKYLGIGVDWLDNYQDVNSSDWTKGIMPKN